MKRVSIGITVAALCLGGASLFAADEPMKGCAKHATQGSAMKDCPMASHAASVDQRGDAGMGFDHNLTEHHFLLRPDGGVIEVVAKSADDSTSVSAIRQHLAHVAGMFATGDFDIPMFIHDQVPPGVPVMKEMKGSIRYRYEEEERGGRIVITSDQPRAVSALHEFLAFQINEHRTGDPLEVTP